MMYRIAGGEEEKKKGGEKKVQERKNEKFNILHTFAHTHTHSHTNRTANTDSGSGEKEMTYFQGLSYNSKILIQVFERQYWN